jgi:PAB1-binding protein PBP1
MVHGARGEANDAVKTENAIGAPYIGAVSGVATEVVGQTMPLVPGACAGACTGAGTSPGPGPGGGGGGTGVQTNGASQLCKGSNINSLRSNEQRFGSEVLADNEIAIKGRRAQQDQQDRKLVRSDAWLGAETAASSLKGGSKRGRGGKKPKWDQFKANARLGVPPSTYSFELYTTHLDKDKFTPKDLQAADELEAKITNERTSNVHVAEERGQQGLTDMDEEDLYSMVHGARGDESLSLKMLPSPEKGTPAVSRNGRNKSPDLDAPVKVTPTMPTKQEKHTAAPRQTSAKKVERIHESLSSSVVHARLPFRSRMIVCAT